MKAVGLTDHGTFAGAIDFLKTCRKKGVRPIIGMEAYSACDHLVKDKNRGRRGNRHLNLIAKNYTGFQNICSMSQEASLNGYYYDPRIDLELLEKHSEGVIVTSACLSSIVNANLASDKYEVAKKAVSLFKDICGEDFYLEMMYHGLGSEGKILPDIQKLGKEMDVKIIVTNDCFIAGTMVLTSKGVIPIENIQRGDEVVTHKNTLSPVEFINERMANETFVVKTVLGTTSFESTGNHPVLTVQRSGNKLFTEPNWKKVSSLSQSDYLLKNEKPKVSRRKFIEVGAYFAVKIKSVCKNKRSQLVYNLQVKGDESYTANSYVVHNCHYINKEDAEFQQVVMCMSSGRCIRDPKRLKFPYDEFYFKTAEEMSKIFGHIPSAMSNTLEISEKCDYSDLIFVEDGGEMKLPKFNIPKEFDSPYSYLKKLAYDGLKNKNLDKSEAHVNRLKIELDDLKLIYDTKRYDFATYFLIVDDIINFSKEKGIMCGIRGSGYGSVLLQCLGITEGVDPIEQNLLWERFLGFDHAWFICEDDFGIKP